MSHDLTIDFKSTAAHISEYIENANLFDVFQIDDIKQIMKYSKLTADQYISLLKQSSSTINAKELYICTRNASVSIQNFEEVVLILKNVKEYMKLNIFDEIFDVLNQCEKELSNYREENNKLREELEELQINVQNTVNQINENNNQVRETAALTMESYNFENVYKYFDELSEEGNKEMMSKACEEGRWEIKKEFGNNVLHVACQRGNLRLVKSLIECNCNIEARNNFGSTPLILASFNDHLSVVKYLISVGANKDANDNDGETPLSFAKGEVRDFLIYIGAR